jgi:hypothetical protein
VTPGPDAPLAAASPRLVNMNVNLNGFGVSNIRAHNQDHNPKKIGALCHASLMVPQSSRAL